MNKQYHTYYAEFATAYAAYDVLRLDFNSKLAAWKINMDKRPSPQELYKGTSDWSYTPMPVRPCPPTKPPPYYGYRLQPSDGLLHNVTIDLAANTTENRFGFGWNTAGMLSIQNGGKSFGVKG